ncbi:conotoxin protein (macronuclear) [Tetrahymena thermophila SB210]|uniref:Conotoxin protein n=1 Tax=Tetrahymena thermophila (strain SB210) TaxID=312017 RepID=W7XJE7_TETTS|nr:conotoxin protein [Tetrahymena thermophila SB210]EWS74094.1 conotoxin protein [Tetrahymena thermophila SB210]|eukprot:XP_012653349.1 conotoxin protein [Tetrahymena thermophila SB210]
MKTSAYLIALLLLLSTFFLLLTKQQAKIEDSNLINEVQIPEQPESANLKCIDNFHPCSNDHDCCSQSCHLWLCIGW